MSTPSSSPAPANGGTPLALANGVSSPADNGRASPAPPVGAVSPAHGNGGALSLAGAIDGPIDGPARGPKTPRHDAPGFDYGKADTPDFIGEAEKHLAEQAAADAQKAAKKKPPSLPSALETLGNELQAFRVLGQKLGPAAQPFLNLVETVYAREGVEAALPVVQQRLASTPVREHGLHPTHSHSRPRVAQVVVVANAPSADAPSTGNMKNDLEARMALQDGDEALLSEMMRESGHILTVITAVDQMRQRLNTYLFVMNQLLSRKLAAAVGAREKLRAELAADLQAAELRAVEEEQRAELVEQTARLMELANEGVARSAKLTKEAAELARKSLCLGPVTISFGV